MANSFVSKYIFISLLLIIFNNQVSCMTRPASIKDMDYNHMLSKACGSGDIGKVTEALLHKASLIGLGKSAYLQPLWLAVSNRHPKIVKALIDANADVSLKSENNNTPLLTAAKNSDISIIKLLIAAAVQREDKQNAFFSAVHSNNLRVVKMFINSGFDVNSMENKLESALQVAIENSSIKMMDLLLKHGANIGLRSNDLPHIYIPLSISNKPVGQLLLQYGASLSLTEFPKASFLIGCFFECKEAVALFISSIQDSDFIEAFVLKDVIARDIFNMTPIAWAACRGNYNLFIKIFNFLNTERHRNIIYQLLSDCNNKGETALSMAIKYRQDYSLKPSIRKHSKLSNGCADIVSSYIYGSSITDRALIKQSIASAVEPIKIQICQTAQIPNDLANIVMQYLFGGNRIKF